MTLIAEMNDGAILALLGERVKQERLNQNRTQADIARKAGVDRIVLTRLENGKGSTLRSMVRVLRSLGKLNHLDLFLPEPGLSPIQLARLSGMQRQEASGGRGKKRRREE